MGETNRTHEFLDKILLKTQYEAWYFGCYHNDVKISPKNRCLFCDVVAIGEKKRFWSFGKK